MITIKPGDFIHVTLWEFIYEEEGDEFKPSPDDFRPFHKAIVAIIKHLYDNDKIALKLQEFDEVSYDYNIGFSAELQKIVQFEAGRYFNFSDVFFGFVEIEGVTIQQIDFAEKRTPAYELEIGVLDKYIQDLPDYLVNNLNRSYWYSRILWARRLNKLIRERDFSCQAELMAGDYNEHNAHKFGIDLFVHYTGMLLQKSIEDNMDTYSDIGVLLICLTENVQEDEKNTSEDYQRAIEWVLQQHQDFPDHPPAPIGQKQNHENFIKYAATLLNDPAKAPNGIPLEITEDDLKNIWHNELPTAGKCKWKGGGNRPFHKVQSKLIGKKN